MAREGMKVNWLSLAAVGVILLPLLLIIVNHQFILVRKFAHIKNNA